jgi:hypothetical protein
LQLGAPSVEILAMKPHVRLMSVADSAEWQLT